MNKKVMIKRWIPAKMEPVPGGQRTAPGTGCYTKEFELSGEYLGTFRRYEENTDGNGGRYAAGYDELLIALDDGTVLTCQPDLVKFVTRWLR